MRLVWVVIPVFLIVSMISIVGVQEGFSWGHGILDIRYQNYHDQQPWSFECFSSNSKLVFKNTNNLPSCVTEETAKKLIQRGWAKIDGDYAWHFENSIPLENTSLFVKYHSSKLPETLEQIKIDDDELVIAINNTQTARGGPTVSILIPNDVFDLSCVEFSTNYIPKSSFMLENTPDGESIKVKQIFTETSDQILDFKFIFGFHEVIISESTICTAVSDDHQKIFSK